MNDDKRLLVVGSDGVCKKGEKVFTFSPFNTFFAAFGEYFTSIRMVVPLIGQCSSGPAIEMPEGMTIIGLPGFKGIVDFAKKAPFILPRVILTLRKEIASSDAIMVIHNDFLGMLAIWEARNRHKSHLFFIGGNQEEVVRHKYSGWKRWAAVWLARFFDRVDQYWLDRGTLVLVTGSELLDRLAGNGRRVFPYFTSLVHESDICTLPSPKILHEQVNILYVGFLNNNKGIDVLLQAIAKYSHRFGINTKLHLVGEGPARPSLETLCHKLRIENDVTFYGFIGDKMDLAEIYRQCDLFVLPSRSEGIPKVLLEAMAYGLPILTTNVGGIPDFIQNGENGVMVRPDDIDALGRALATLIDDNVFREKLVQGGRNYIRKHTMEAQAAEITSYLLHEGRAFFANV